MSSVFYLKIASNHGNITYISIFLPKLLRVLAAYNVQNLRINIYIYIYIYIYWCRILIMNIYLPFGRYLKIICTV